MRSTLSLIKIPVLLILLSSCAENEREQLQQQQYESELMQQMVQSNEAFNTQLETLLDRYFDLKNALVETDAGLAASHSEHLVEQARQIRTGDLNDESVMAWSGLADRIVSEGEQISLLVDPDDQRLHFEEISEAMILLVELFQPVGYEIYVQSCPMVRDGSAAWLSREERIRNPYHGDRMMNCGEVLRRI